MYEYKQPLSKKKILRIVVGICNVLPARLYNWPVSLAKAAIRLAECFNSIALARVTAE